MGTPDSKYQEVVNFLKKNTCENLILNWDIIDWRYLSYFKKRPKKQKEAIEYILNFWIETKTKITYIKWNHEKFWKNFLPINNNKIIFTDQIIYKSGSKKYLICHGQQFDKQIIFFSKIAETIWFFWGLVLFRLNRIFNNRRAKRWYEYLSIASKIKRIAKKISIWWTKSFEKKVVKAIKENKCDWLICWHLHKPEIKKIWKYDYLNSWDRVESLTALVETNNNEWKLINYKK